MELNFKEVITTSLICSCPSVAMVTGGGGPGGGSGGGQQSLHGRRHRVSVSPGEGAGCSGGEREGGMASGCSDVVSHSQAIQSRMQREFLLIIERASIQVTRRYGALGLVHTSVD